MRIDRARFLTLTAMLTGACTRQPSSTAPRGGSAPDEHSAEPTVVVAVPGEEEAPDEADGGEPEAPASEVAGCDDSRGNPGDCQAIEAPPPGPQCEGGLGFRGDCEVLKGQLDPRVAERFVDCMLAKSETRALCSDRGFADCERQAISQACVDPKAERQCEKALSACRANGLPSPSSEGYTGPPMSVETCQKVLSAVRSEYESDMIDCMSRSCSEVDAYGCIFRLRYTDTARKRSGR
jgi:hypothetical protein